jgi:hypothetical protein
MNEEVKGMLPYGTRVTYNYNDVLVYGKIVGIALADLPFIGASYIIEPEDDIRTKEYPYTHFVANTKMFYVVDENGNKLKNN